VARPLRIQFEGALYHVFSQGSGKRVLFHTRTDREKFLQIIEDAYKRFGIIVHAYCLMNDHYHFIIETPRANISKAMQFIHSNYNTHYIHTHGRTGQLFQGRFKAILIERETYLKRLSRFVHLNSVRSGLAQQPEDHEWSSYRFFIADNGNLPPIFLDMRTTLAIFDADSTDAREKYMRYVELGIGQPMENPLKATRMQSILGSDEFVEEIKETYLQVPYALNSRINGNARSERKGDEIIIERINSALAALKEANEKTKRKMRLYFLRKFTSKTLDEIVSMLDKPLTITAISKTVSRLGAERQGNPVLDVLMQQVEEKLKR